MEHFQQLVQQGGMHAWVFLPTALVLGALHGLEPGHSKTMMAAFIIAIRGTVGQAVLLGLCAALSHSLLIWALAALALHFGSQWNAESTEPYFQVVSAVMIVGLGLWMAWRTWRDVQAENQHNCSHHHDHNHDHGHDHDYPQETSLVEYQDAHEKAHSDDIQKRFSDGKATTGQIALFGLTGGLLPCPAAFTVVLVCLQLKKFALGIAMVLAFSIGLAITLVAAGALAAWGLHHAQKRFTGLGSIARKLPYVSSIILVLMGLFIGFEGWRHLAAQP